jgi:hypothetical protein
MSASRNRTATFRSCAGIEVDAGHGKASRRQLDRMAPFPARQVEHALAVGQRQRLHREVDFGARALLWITACLDAPPGAAKEVFPPAGAVTHSTALASYRAARKRAVAAERNER